MQTGNFQLVREINRRLIFSLIRQQEQTSRSSLVETTALSKATVSAVVDELIGRGLVVEGAATSVTVGRRPILLQVNRNGPYLAALQVLPDKVTGGLVDLDGHVIDRVEKPCQAGMGQSHIRAVVDVLLMVKTMAVKARHMILGAGVSVPGILNPLHDVVLSAPCLGWRDVSLARMLEAAVSFPVWLGDEAKLAALAEATTGEGKGADMLLYLGLGATVGVGLVQRGQLLSGTHAGHLTILPDGPQCWCGNKGCLDALVNEENLRRMARELLASGRGFYREPEEITGHWLSLQAEAGDPLAWEIMAEAGRWLGIGTANLINLFQPELVLVGGWASRRPILNSIRQEVAMRVLPAIIGPVRIVPASIQQDAVFIGAAALALEGALDRRYV